MMTAPRVYSLVNNSITSLLTYDIAQLPNQPKVSQVVLLLNDRKKLTRFLDNDSKLVLRNSEGMNFHGTQFMASYRPPMYSSGELAVMDNFIASAKHLPAMIQSMKKFKDSLNCNSNILLLNPPFGTIEQLYKNFWSLEERPNIMVGVTHSQNSYYATEPEEFHFRLRRKDIGLKLSALPRNFSNYNHEQMVQDLESFQKNNALMKLVRDASQNHDSPISINLMLYPHDELLLLRLENLIISSCIRPLVFLLGCYSKSELLDSKKILLVVYQMIQEQTSILIRCHPFLKNIPGYNIALDSERLYEQTVETLKRSKRNYLDVLECINVRELTGYFVQLAHYRKLDCKWNRTITTLVQAKTEFEKYKALDYLRLP